MLDLRREYLGIGFLLVLTGLLYLPARRAGFVYDDRWFVVNNTGIRHIDIRRIVSDPRAGAVPGSGLEQDTYRPAVTLSLALDYALWGLSPLGYHVENLLLHLFNGILVWLLFRRMLSQPTAALLATAVFLWLPVQVQAVAYVSQRTTLLGSLGMLLTLWWLGPPGPWSGIRLLGGWLTFGMALLCRETAGGVILALGVIDRVYVGQKTPRFWLRYAGLILLTVIYILLRSRLLPAWSTVAGPRNFRADAAIGAMAFAVYIGKLLWPIHLRFHYAYPSPDALRIALSFLIFGLYGALTAWASVYRPRLAAGLAWIFIFLIPVLQIIPFPGFVSERYLYFSVIGLAWMMGEAYCRYPAVRPLLGGVLILYAWLGLRQAAIWQTEETLWTASIQQDPRDSYAQAAYAGVARNPKTAEDHYRLALIGDATDAVRVSAYINLSWFALQRKQFRGAEIFAEDALRIVPHEPHALYNLMLARQRRR